MIIIIDAYNVLKQMIPHDYISSAERAAFINQLVSYNKDKKHTIILVFDGGPHTWPQMKQIKNIEVVYSGMQQNADTYIKNYIANNKQESILLVSSDRELVQWASFQDVASVGSTDFYHIVKEVRLIKSNKKECKTVSVKTGNSHNEQLDELMRSSSIPVIRKEDDKESNHITTRGKRLKKKDRALLRKVNKL